MQNVQVRLNFDKKLEGAVVWSKICRNSLSAKFQGNGRQSSVDVKFSLPGVRRKGLKVFKFVVKHQVFFLVRYAHLIESRHYFLNQIVAKFDFLKQTFENL